MSPTDPALADAAALWAARTRDPAFRDWEGFTIWLEADPRHNAAYEAALDADDLADLLGTGAVPAAPTDPVPVEFAGAAPVGRRWHSGWASAAAAALVAVGLVSAPSLLPHRDGYEIATAAGEQRSVRLPDGTQIALNGDSRLLLDHARPRAVTLDRGEASFTVVHDAANPFTVGVGNSRIEDAGTTFNVRRMEDATEVGVAEGSVVYDPDGAQVKVVAGGTLRDTGGGAAIEVARIDPAAVGAWRHGRLTYHGAPLSQVAADLTRATGEPVTADPSVAARPYSGTIIFRDTPPARLFGRVGALTGTRAVQDAGGWRLTAEAGASR